MLLQDALHIWYDQSNRQKSLQTFAVVISQKHNHVIQAQFYSIMTNLLSPIVLFHNIFNECRSIKARVYQHKLIFGPSPIRVGHEIHTNHVKNLLHLEQQISQKGHKFAALHTEHLFYNFVIWDTLVTITGCAFWYKLMKKLKKKKKIVTSKVQKHSFKLLVWLSPKS